MGSELSMHSRAEITAKYARAYAKSSKKERGRCWTRSSPSRGGSWTTPADRLLTARVLSPAQEAELRARRDRLNPAELARNTTLDLHAAITAPQPHTAGGIRLRHAS